MLSIDIKISYPLLHKNLGYTTYIIFVAIGPLTNLYRALLQDASICASISELVIMGGHLKPVTYCDRLFSWGLDYNLYICSVLLPVINYLDVQTLWLLIIFSNKT